MTRARPAILLYDLAQRTFSPVGPFVQVAGAPNKIRLTPITGFNDEGQFVGSFRLRNQQYGGFGTLSIGPPGSTAPPADPGSFTQIECPEGRAMNATRLMRLNKEICILHLNLVPIFFLC